MTTPLIWFASVVVVGIAGAVCALAVISLFVDYKGAKALALPPATGREAMVGRTAGAATELNPGGKVLLDGTYWDAIADSHVPAGAPVRITRVERLTLIVSPHEVDARPARP